MQIKPYLKRSRLGWFVPVLCGLLLPAFGSVAEGIKLSDDIQIEKLQDGVWRHITTSNYPGYGLVPANGLIVAGQTNAVLVDTGWTPEQTGKILNWIETNLHTKVTGVVVTHSHVDRMGGIAEAMRRGLPVFACRRTAELARSAGLPVPQEAFDEKMEIVIDPGIRLELEYPGPGHTVDNIVVWLPRQKILFGGCLIKAAKDKSPGYTKDADLDAWPGTVARVEQEFPDTKTVVPGHGDAGGTNLLSHTIELVQKAKAVR